MESCKYEKNLNTVITNGFITSALCIGYDLGIFDALKQFDVPVTSEELARECGLKERYVREWLGCMVAANIIETGGNNTYFIPQNCKQYLQNIYAAKGVPLFGKMLVDTKDYFKKDGPKGSSFLKLEPELLDWIYGGLFSPDQLISEVLDEVKKLKGTIDTVLEVGCGEGILSRTISRAIPQADIYAGDYNPESIERAKRMQSSDGYVTYEVQDVRNLPKSWDKKFCMILIRSVLHDLPNPLLAITEIRRVLKDDGVAVIIDPGVHSSHNENKGDILCAAYFYAISCFICLPNSMNMENAAGLGIGWGIEEKQKYLEENAFVIKGKRKLLNNNKEYAMFCMKT